MARNARAKAVSEEPVEGPWELPEGWRWERLGAVVEKTGAKCKPNPRSTLSFVGLENIPSHEMRVTGSTSFSTMKSAASAFSKDDVLYSRLRPYLNKVWVADRDGACSGELLVLRPADDVRPAYLGLWMHASWFVSLASHLVTGDRPRADFDQLALLGIPIPPPHVQDRIVARVDALVAEIDEGEKALAEARAGVDTYRKALLKAAVTGELTADWRAQNPARETGEALLQRLLAERRARWDAANKGGRKSYIEPVGVSLDDLRPLPNGWAWATVQQLSTLVTSGSRGWSEHYADEGSLFIRAANLKLDRLDLSEVAFVQLPANIEGTRTKVEQGDFLITITGANVTKCGIIEDPIEDAYVSQHVGLVRPLTPRVGQYLYLWSRAYGGGKQYLEEAAYGAGKPGLNLPNVYEMNVALPPPEEMEEIVARTEHLLVEVAEAEGDLVSRATDLRQSILAAAFRGDLVA